MTGQDRQELGALFARITRNLIAAERPLLEARGLTMWGYIALSHLAHRPAGTQLELAGAIGYDKTRLIGLLDQLEADGLIARRPDPSDRRARLVSISQKGRKRQAAAAADIRAMETRMLAGLGAAEQRALLKALPKLAAGSRSQRP